jgi:hypothetical protein
MESLTTILRELKDLGAVGIKNSFEDEGALMNEVMTMRSLTHSVGLELALKIGGCEAKRDIVDSINLNVDAIVAPMVESGFSLKKFIDSVGGYNIGNTKIGFNLETITSYLALNEFKPYFEHIDFVTFGRVDFIGSYGKERSYVESLDMREKIENVFKIAKESNIKCYLGGAMSVDSFELVQYLKEHKLLDRIETRYIIFDVSKIDMAQFDYIMYLANVFEVKWLNYIKSRYESYALKDANRIIMIQKRLDANPVNKK